MKQQYASLVVRIITVSEDIVTTSYPIDQDNTKGYELWTPGAWVDNG